MDAVDLMAKERGVCVCVCVCVCVGCGDGVRGLALIAS
jgi:hypothetical protein